MDQIVANVLQPLISAGDSVMVFFHNSFGFSWGFSIIALTIVVRALLVPLTIKQFKSMQKLQRVQPQIKALQQKYKHDRQRQNQEIMKFYRENKVNPFGSCLPLLLQLPVFLALFYMLRHDLRRNICGQTAKACGLVIPGSAQFLFVPDITAPATGWVLAVLILMYVGSQIASTMLMSTTMDKNQRRLMLVLPLVFAVFVIQFPAGLIIYWITTNVWTIGQQYAVKRMVGPLEPLPTTAAVAPGKKSNDGEPAPVKSKDERKPKDERSPEKATVTAPPRAPRKKKKRSGRRR